MAFQKFDTVPGSGNQWCYIADQESDIATAPQDAFILLVLDATANKSQWRIKNKSGQWIEFYGNKDTHLYPTDTLYPSETLYPKN